MKPKLPIVLSVALVLFTGCASQVWYQPGKSAAETYQALADAKARAHRDLDPHGVSVFAPRWGRGNPEIEEFVSDSMRAQGWTPVTRTDQNRDYPPK